MTEPTHMREESLIDRAHSSDRLRQAAVVIGAVGEIAAAWYAVRSGNDDFARPAPGGDPPIVPAPYAFAIWTPIFAGMLGYAAYQLLPRQTVRPLLRRTGWPAAIATLGAAAWLLVALDPARVWGTVAILAAMTVALGIAHRALEDEIARDPRVLDGAERWFVRVPLGLFFGWCSVATFANFASALRYSGVTRPGAETVPTIALLAGATIAATAITASMRRNGWYAGTVVWALAAIALANASGTNRPTSGAIAAVAVIGMICVLGALVLARRASAVMREANGA